jgi:hypothetical protein
LFIKLKKGNGGYHRDSEHRLWGAR